MKSAMTPAMKFCLARLGTAAIALLLAACAARPPPPDWQGGARSALDAAVQAHLLGDTRVAQAEMARARAEVARTGRLSLAARTELVLCAAQVASLELEGCPPYSALARDAGPSERAYRGLPVRQRRPGGRAAAAAAAPGRGAGPHHGDPGAGRSAVAPGRRGPCCCRPGGSTRKPWPSRWKPHRPRAGADRCWPGWACSSRRRSRRGRRKRSN